MSSQRSSEKAFPEEDPEFQVAPMIDILLVLMTFFMAITSTEVLKTKTKIANINLPVAPDSNKKGTDRSEVLINVGWNPKNPGKEGVIECEEQLIPDPSRLSSMVTKRKQSQPALRAVIRASEEVPYSFVQLVMGACAEADVDNITFLVLNQEKVKQGGAK